MRSQSKHQMKMVATIKKIKIKLKLELKETTKFNYLKKINKLLQEI